MKYKKKPIPIDAKRITVFNLEEIADWCGGKVTKVTADAKYRLIAIKTLEGSMEAAVGDWILKGVKGEFYPCRNDIFEETYEIAND